ncbi:MAG: hypothetical protein EA397_18735 [Deltaproteobacteria bacterium]|nr:MAG: hypothetical protein EA397_18735 [Deltaproteobacteria bacterium]
MTPPSRVRGVLGLSLVALTTVALTTVALAQEPATPPTEEARPVPDLEEPEPSVSPVEAPDVEDDSAPLEVEPDGSSPPDLRAEPEEEGPLDLDAEIKALKSELADLRQQVGAQGDRLTAQGADLLGQKRVLREKEEVQVDLEGYYRTRGYIYPRLNEGQTRHARVMDMRLRLRPIISYKKLARVIFQVDAFDDVVWGDNAGVAQTPIFAADPSNTNREGLTIPSIQMTRAWLEVTTPIGEVRAGRMASHWGLGLIANDGNGFDDTFGENRFGNTFDRVMYATRPIAIAQAIAGKKDTEVPFFFVAAVDRLVNQPIQQFYGFRCTAGLREGVDPGYDPRCDRSGDGFTDVSHDFTEDRDPERRSQRWWADQDTDVAESVFALIYRGEDLKLLGDSDKFTIGGYLITRWQHSTDSLVYVPDLWIDFNLDGWVGEFEGLHITGQSRGLVLPGAYDPTGEIDDPLYKEVSIWGYVGRFGHRKSDWEIIFEHGFASGDSNVADRRFTGRALEPDHNVGLIIYDQIMARVTAGAWSRDARPLWSRGGVVNSRYIFPHARYSPMDDVDIVGAFLMAWPHRPDGATILCRPGEGCGQAQATANALGWEVDLALKVRWQRHVLFSIEAAYARVTDRVPLGVAGLDSRGHFTTLQSRLAYQF